MKKVISNIYQVKKSNLTAEKIYKNRVREDFGAIVLYEDNKYFVELPDEEAEKQFDEYVTENTIFEKYVIENELHEKFVVSDIDTNEYIYMQNGTKIEF